MMTETNAKPIEPTCSMCPSYPRIQAEINRLTAELKEKEGEVEKLTHERDLWENMAAMRLADQVAIERHTRRAVAGECAAMASGCYYAKTMAEAIKKKYGVE